MLRKIGDEVKRLGRAWDPSDRAGVGSAMPRGASSAPTGSKPQVIWDTRFGGTWTSAPR